MFPYLYALWEDSAEMFPYLYALWEDSAEIPHVSPCGRIRPKCSPPLRPVKIWRNVPTSLRAVGGFSRNVPMSPVGGFGRNVPTAIKVFLFVTGGRRHCRELWATWTASSGASSRVRGASALRVLSLGDERVEDALLVDFGVLRGCCIWNSLTSNDCDRFSPDIREDDSGFIVLLLRLGLRSTGRRARVDEPVERVVDVLVHVGRHIDHFLRFWVVFVHTLLFDGPLKDGVDVVHFDATFPDGGRLFRPLVPLV